jgi:hypothetical protein
LGSHHAQSFNPNYGFSDCLRFRELDCYDRGSAPPALDFDELGFLKVIEGAVSYMALDAKLSAHAWLQFHRPCLLETIQVRDGDRVPNLAAS